MLIDLFLQSCIDPIAFQSEEKESKLVIFGSFTDQYIDHEVTIAKTDKFGTNGIAISGALVEIIEENGNKAQYFETGEGKYTLPKGSLEGIPGKSYQLSVSLADKTYESSWEEMPETITIRDTYFDIEFKKLLSESDYLIQQFFIDIYIDTPLITPSGEKAFLRWEIDETYSFSDLMCGGLDPSSVCYFSVPSPFGELKVFGAFDESQKDLTNYMVFSRLIAPYIQFNELHYFNVSQYSISSKTYDYWERINIVSNPTGSIFDRIPSGVQGNLVAAEGDQEVLGYFEVASVSIDRTATTWQEVNANIQIPQACNPYMSIFSQPDYCCSCFLLPNIIPKPDYWGER